MTPRIEWLDTVVREAQVRSGLVLYGNTRDLFWTGTGSDYVTLPELLHRSLEDFTIHARWDRVDGLRFGSETQARRWLDAVERAVAEPEPEGDAYELDDDGSERAPSTIPEIGLAEILAQYRAVLSNSEERPLVIIDWSHLLLTHAGHPDAEERTWLLQLGKALVGDATQRIDSDELAHRGMLVVVSASLGAVPPPLYQGEPRIRLLSVPPPGRAERHAFFTRHADDLRVERPRASPGTTPSPDRPAIVEALSDLSDQLTTADLKQLVALSRSVDAPLRPDRLLNLYRFGDQHSPWEELSEERLSRVDEELRSRVLGQDDAVEHAATTIIRAWLGLAGLQHSARRTKPKGTMFFVGPTGVGKTELAKACAEFLFGDEGACLRFDMSEYNHEHSDQRLIGAPPGYVGFEEGGLLTNAVRSRPFSVLLFDEIEKAHGRILDKFLQILEDGRLTDGRGETAWFNETVIVFTSNLGSADLPKDATTPAARERHFQAAVEHHFVRELGRPELLNRLGDNIVVFQPIEAGDLRRRILGKKLEPLGEHLRERWGVELRLGEEILEQLVRHARTDHGGRGLINAVERELLNPLARFLFSHHVKLRRGRAVLAQLDGPLVDFELRDA